ncbi:hypothetical protein LSE82_004248 [Salmonella enterica]|nr:hypothetical protein [Salmonella enterica]
MYGTTLTNRGYSVPVKSVNGNIVSGGNTLGVPVKSVYGYLLVTEV